MAAELIHTEEEASKILCPQFKTGCRGSGCMWWRWSGIAPNVAILGESKEAWEYRKQAPRVGYCGVAGRP